MIDQEKKILNDYRNRNKTKKNPVDKKMEKETLMRIGVMLEHISELVRKKEEIKSQLSEEIVEDIRLNPESYSELDEESLKSLGIDTKSIKDARSISQSEIKGKIFV